MPLTPADIHNMSFKKPAIGRGGYVEEEVDAFLDEVERELARLMAENGALKERARHGGGPGGEIDEIRELMMQLRRMEEARARAEQHAREVQAELQQAQEQAVVQARRAEIAPGDDERHLRVLAMAQRTADEHLRDAQRESEELIDAARDQAARFAEDARAKAVDIENDARRRHAEAMDGLAGRRAAMLDEIEQLSGLATHYRDALARHVAAQLADVDDTPRLTGP